MLSSHGEIIREILIARGYVERAQRQAFLSPDYDAFRHDPFLLPDMAKAVERIIEAYNKKQSVVIYGDYDIDGLSATALLLDALSKFGLYVRAFIPNRFIDGYGLSREAIEKIASESADLIITVDCGSLSFEEIARANELGVDVIVTDHHSVAETMPDAVAVINPKRLTNSDSSQSKTYPFTDLAGVGVAFKLVQALQTQLDGLPAGQEKWLLDLVALGTVCDIVSLSDENRVNVHWGLQVLKKTRRPGLRALMAVARVKPSEVTARTLGFVLGPRLNASGRLETAQLSLDLLTTTDSNQALMIAEKLEQMNQKRRTEQDRIFASAKTVAEQMQDDKVLVLSDSSWSHGIIGIVASKLVEKYKKPTFILQELADGTAKGSARSFGDFSAVEAIRATDQHLIKGGGHKFAAGVTLEIDSINAWREAINQYYDQQKLVNQIDYLQVAGDIELVDFSMCTAELVGQLAELEPYGNGNPEPVFEFASLVVESRRTMGANNQHVKYCFVDRQGRMMNMIAFNKADEFVASAGDQVRVWCELGLNQWSGRRSIEGVLRRMQVSI